MQLSSNFSLVFTFLSWSFLPSIVTKFLLTLLYSFSILPKPSNPSQAATHAHSARAFAILAYLAYSFSQTIQTLPPNYYQLLELPLDVDPDAVKKSFRSLARKYHPDKVGDRGQALFILLRKAHDVLQDPVKRFAYDRFGPEVLDWRDAISLREHMIKGLKSSIGFYIVNPIVYAIINYFGGGNKGGSDFWRLALLFSMLSLELHLLLSQNYPFLPRILLPRTTIHQFISVLHEVFTITLLASQQLGPVLKSLDRHALDQMLVGGAIGTDQDKDPNELSRQMEVVASLSAELQQKSSANLSRCVSLVAADLRPLRPQDVTTVETAQDVAASISGSPPRPAGSTRMKGKARDKTKEEEAWIHLYGKKLTKRMLETHPGMRKAMLEEERKEANFFKSQLASFSSTAADAGGLKE